MPTIAGDGHATSRAFAIRAAILAALCNRAVASRMSALGGFRFGRGPTSFALFRTAASSVPPPAGRTQSAQDRIVFFLTKVCPSLALTADAQLDHHEQNPASLTLADWPFLVGWAMSLCWCSNTEVSKASLNVRLLLAFYEFLFEDILRSARLWIILAVAGAGWFLWLGYLSVLHPSGR